MKPKTPSATERELRKDEVIIEVIQGVEGLCLSVADTRIAGPKPWGGGSVVRSWVVPVQRILDAIQLTLEES